MGFERTDEEVEEHNANLEATRNAFDEAMREFVEAARDQSIHSRASYARDKAVKAAVAYGLAHNGSVFEPVKRMHFREFEFRQQDDKRKSS